MGDFEDFPYYVIIGALLLLISIAVYTMRDRKDTKGDGDGED